MTISDQVCSTCGAFEATVNDVPTGYCANIPGHPWVPRTMTDAEKAEVFDVDDAYRTEIPTTMPRKTFASRDWGTVTVVHTLYNDGNNAVLIRDDDPSPIATLSVNIPELAGQLEPNEFFVKTWSENEQIAADALASGLFADTGKRVPLEHVQAQVWRVVGGWDSLGPLG